MNRSFGKATVIILAGIFTVHCTVAQDNALEKEIRQIAHSVKAHVGVAVMHLGTGNTVSINGNDHFPMQSVYKFHLALKVLKDVEHRKLSLDQTVHIPRKDLMMKTWSPVLKRYPDGDIDLQLKVLLQYLVSQGDNNICDALFRLVGGPREIEKYIHSLGVTDVAVANTEAEMHSSWNVQFNNWSTPLAMIQLLEQFHKGNILSGAHQALLYKMMTETVTGGKRIKGLLPPATVVAHRTGMGGPNKDGVLGALNDVGIVALPDGSYFAIAVFISNTKEDPVKLEEVIARIARKVYEHYTV